MQTMACANCVFFEEHHINAGQTDEEKGLCRYNPPVAQPSPDQRGLWPVVTAADWCGHYTGQRGVAHASAEERAGSRNTRSVM